MFQYLIMGYDPGTAEGLAHRMTIRPLHFEFIKKYKERGELLIGGAQLDEAQNMKGSSLILQFEDAEGIETYEANEPYIINKVWETYTIIPFRVANV
jgi:uncharacterized protein